MDLIESVQGTRERARRDCRRRTMRCGGCPTAPGRTCSRRGFLRALQPARFGGGEVTLVDFVDAAIELSRASPSAGWVAGVIGVHPWQLALFSEEAQQEMWGADPTAMHSSSYNPTGKAEKVDGGYKVYGRWSFSSGCDHCRAVNLGAIAVRATSAACRLPDFRSFLLHRDQYRIEDNWHVAGLQGHRQQGHRGRGRVRAGAPHAVAHRLPAEPAAAGPGSRNDGPLYRLPWSVVFNMALAASVLGSARGFVELWTEISRTRTLRCRRASVADDPLMQQRLADATWDLEAAVTRMRADAHRAVADGRGARARVDAAPRADALEHDARLRARRRRSVNDLFHAASGRTIFLDQPLGRRFLDVQGALGHAFLVPDPLARAVGGTLLGTSKPEVVL